MTSNEICTHTEHCEREVEVQRSNNTGHSRQKIKKERMKDPQRELYAPILEVSTPPNYHANSSWAGADGVPAISAADKTHGNVYEVVYLSLLFSIQTLTPYDRLCFCR